jgi:cyanate lyase
MASSSSTITVDLDLDEAIKSAGISVHTLADMTGIARTTLRRKIKRPGTLTLDEYAELAAALKLSESALRVAS